MCAHPKQVSENVKLFIDCDSRLSRLGSRGISASLRLWHRRNSAPGFCQLNEGGCMVVYLYLVLLDPCVEWNGCSKEGGITDSA